MAMVAVGVLLVVMVVAKVEVVVVMKVMEAKCFYYTECFIESP